ASGFRTSFPWKSTVLKRSAKRRLSRQKSFNTTSGFVLFKLIPLFYCLNCFYCIRIFSQLQCILNGRFRAFSTRKKINLSLSLLLCFYYIRICRKEQFFPAKLRLHFCFPLEKVDCFFPLEYSRDRTAVNRRRRCCLSLICLMEPDGKHGYDDRKR